MKKAMSLLALGAIFLTSCGQPATTETVETTDSTTVAADSTTDVDSCATMDTDSVVVDTIN